MEWLKSSFLKDTFDTIFQMHKLINRFLFDDKIHYLLQSYYIEHFIDLEPQFYTIERLQSQSLFLPINLKNYVQISLI
jgi:hypothetical protein